MAKLLKLRRGNTSQHGSFTGAEGEVTVDTDKDTLVVHDGSTQSGFSLLREDMSNLPAGTIDNADINVSAGISGTKISPNFGSQNISTTGTLGFAGGTSTGNITISSTAPQLLFTDTDNNPDYAIWNNDGTLRFIDSGANATRFEIQSGGLTKANNNLQVVGNITASGTIGSSGNVTITNQTPALALVDSGQNPDWEVVNNNGTFVIKDSTANASKFYIESDGSTNIVGNLDAEAGLDVTGNITVTGTVDGVDVGALNTAVSGLSSGSAALTNGVTATTQGASDNTTKVATTAYVTTAISNLINGAPGSLDTLNELAAAMSDDAAFSTTVTNSLATKLPLAGGQMTGNITFSGSQTVDGRDLSADGSKLDNIEAGATADQTKADIDSLGINADQVDGLEASQFLRADAADTAGSDITFSGGGGAVTIAAGSDIRGTAGTWTGEAAGKLQWHSNHMYFQTASNWIFRSQNGTERAYIDSSGNYVGTGNVTAYSDARLKTNVNTINDALSIVGKLRGVSFDWKADGKHSIGVIAQEVEEILPEVVLNNVNTDPTTGKTKEVKSVDYGKIVGVLINAVNELKAEVDELKVFLLGEELGGK